MFQHCCSSREHRAANFAKKPRHRELCEIRVLPSPHKLVAVKATSRGLWDGSGVRYIRVQFVHKVSEAATALPFFGFLRFYEAKLIYAAGFTAPRGSPGKPNGLGGSPIPFPSSRDFPTRNYPPSRRWIPLESNTSDSLVFFKGDPCGIPPGLLTFRAVGS